ncbi:MAG: transposase [Chloroflexota bacterium]|nr:transposase [Ardenticatenaceae bacterium]
MEKRGLGDRLREEGVNHNSTIGWADEMRLGLISQVRRVWAPVGVKIIQKIQISYTYIYLHLVVDGLKGTIHWIWAENMKQESVVKAMIAWQHAGIDVFVWDGAPSHRGNDVKALGATLVSQPPYSPELNPAERVFEAIRAEVEGKLYATIADKQVAVENFLKDLSATPERIKQLAGWAWIQEAIASLANPAT